MATLAGMRKKDSIKYFGSVKHVAEVLGISTQAVYNWPDRVPKTSAALLYILSDHKLNLRLQDYTDESDRPRTNPVPSPQAD